LNAEKVSGLTGAFYDSNNGILEATGFIIRKDKTVEMSVYCNGPIGHLKAKDVLGFANYYRRRKEGQLKTIAH
jgi:hypothetical protein